MVNTQDIQGKISSSVDTKIRKAWVSQVTPEMKNALSKIPGPQKLALYKTFDKEVNALWVEKLKNHRQNALLNGAKMVRKNGVLRLEDQYCDKTDQYLIEAAYQFVTEFTKSI